jgi:predicted GNAT family acetyltransferase
MANPEFGHNPEAQNEHPQTDLVITELPELSQEEKFARRKANKEAKERERELASEICGKYQKGDQFGFVLEKRGSAFSILIEGVQVGGFMLKDNGDTKSIGMIMLNDNLKGKGFGKQLYTKLNDYFRSTDGSVLMSDTMRLSEEAEGLWKSLVKDGLAEETDIDTADGHKVYKFNI